MTLTTLFSTAAPARDLISLSAIRRRADRLILMLVWLLWLVSLALGLLKGQWLLALVAGALLTAISTISCLVLPGKLLTRLIFAFVLMAWSALLIQLGDGETEYHFSVFVLLSALLAWRDWKPLLVGAAVIAVHHLTFNYLQQYGLFNIVVFEMGPGLHMVIMHAVFVVVQTLILVLMAIRMEQDARSASEVAKLASVINREPGCVTLTDDSQASHSSFARTFSLTLGTMRNTLVQVSHSVSLLIEDAQTLLQRNSSLSERTDNQARSLAVAASAMEQLAGAAALTSEKASEARGLALEASHVAQEGGKSVSAAMASMTHIRDESLRVNGILELIDSIAFQTNILSLNASVEAARAGEQGKGFAVVAAEVRTLALRSESAAKEIRQLIATSVESTQQGADQVGQAGKTMQVMIGRIESLLKLVEDLSQMSEQQRASILQINASIASIDASVQENLQHVAQTMQVAQQQQKQTGELKTAISVFRLV
ncbi:methyl-accepting chemotaxis protein [Enterobacteriaceae bacterium 89]|nr:methyl-accepting chemotaxis protein [Enterobacteriaceae bacterium 89]